MCLWISILIPSIRVCEGKKQGHGVVAYSKEVMLIKSYIVQYLETEPKRDMCI